MAVEARAAAEEQEQYQDDDSLGVRLANWVRTELLWYAGSFTFHVIGLSLLLLIPGAIVDSAEDTRRFDAVQAEKPEGDEPQKLEPFDVDKPEETLPPVLNVDPKLEQPGREAQEEGQQGDKEVRQPEGNGTGGGAPDGSNDLISGMMGFSGVGPGAKMIGLGIGPGRGTGDNWGSGGNGFGFRDGGKGRPGTGPTIRSERAVTGALVWLARHQLSDGSWSLQNYVQRCSDHTCTGPGNVTADTGATALGVLPFLAAGQTHRTKGPYQANVRGAILWLIRRQKADGNLAAGAQQPMYSHALATIALCEAAGMTGDESVRLAAQRAVDYIVMAQNKGTGGWRYTPGEEGDTSVVGWGVMALKSALMAGLSVGGSGGGGAAFHGASKWLDSVQSGPHNSQYAYQPGSGPQNTMTSVGLLCRQYLGAKRDSPMMADGVKYLMDHMPGDEFRGVSNIYYDYYATQVLHNMNNSDWDTWNRRMRDLLVKSQNRDIHSCANGSWDPAGDQWARSGGRLMMTSLAALTLEIYYRYLPLFKADMPVM
ncbi:MAG: prenyltransferase/squalene oxidase repeat-containing protein [Thermoguttaceae bacterium]|jgi:hypothetical protein